MSPPDSADAAPVCLQLALPVPLYTTFDYLPEADRPASDYAIGQRVVVPFGQRRLAGVVLGRGPARRPSGAGRLRRVLHGLEPEPVLPAPLLELVAWAAGYYHHPVGEALFTLLPPSLREIRETRKTEDSRWQVTGREADNLLDRAPRQAALLSWLAQAGPATPAEMRVAGYSAALQKGLSEKGLIEPANAGPPPTATIIPATSGPRLTREQRQAITAFAPEQPGYRVSLLEGVTGSGKTEVYLQIIGQVLTGGRQALLLVPEISLTPQTFDRLRARFGNSGVAALHSGMGRAARRTAWQAFSDGSARVLIGARSAVLAPMRNPGLLIVDEEHDTSFKQQDGFRYNARDLAVKRGQTEDIPVLLGSATPSLESLHNQVRGRYQWLTLTERAHGLPPPGITLLDVRGKPLEAGISAPMAARIRAHLGEGGQVLLFRNRRGYAPVLVCDECGWNATCPRCDMRLTVHLRVRELRCHHCEHRAPVPGHCPDCGEPALAMLGAGTQRIAAHLEAQFPGVPVLRVDRDATRNARDHAEVARKLSAGEPAILVGTQMLAKGHDFPHLTLVAVIDADAGLLSSDFRGLEHTAQLLVQVAGRAGRAERPGEVVVQTRQPDHPLLQTLVHAGYRAFAESLLEDRGKAGLPPHTALAVVHAECRGLDTAMAFLEHLASTLRGDRTVQPIAHEIWGPAPSPLQRRAGHDRAQLVLCAPGRAQVQKLLQPLGAAIAAHPLTRKVRWAIDVDPVDLF